MHTPPDTYVHEDDEDFSGNKSSVFEHGYVKHFGSSFMGKQYVNVILQIMVRHLPSSITH